MIRNKLIAAYLIPTVLLLVVGCVVIFFEVRASLERELGQRLVAVAEASVGSLPSGEPRRIAKLSGDDETTLKRLTSKLEAVRAATRVRRVFLVDPRLRSLADTRDGVAFGDELFELQADRVEMERVFRAPGVATSSVMFTGKDGVEYKNGYAPIVFEGDVVGALGVEGSSEFFDVLDDFQRLLVALVVTGLFLIVLVSLMLARSMTRPIDQLVVASDRLGRGDLTAPIEMDRRDEFRDLADAFNEMRQNLLDRDEQMQMMLRGIAHEVRNPLGGMELFSGLLAEELEPESQQADYIKKIQKELGYLGRVVNDFLNYARRQPLELTRIEAKPFLEELVNLLAWDLDAQGVKLVLASLDEGLELTLDTQRLRPVLINLLRNAGQASEAGGDIELWAVPLASNDLGAFLDDYDYAARVILGSSVAEADSWRAICIRDGGCGIAADKLGGVFQPFFTTKEKGSGLGLALAQRRVEEHGGSLAVASTPRGDGPPTTDSGTLMVVLLPFVSHIEQQAMVVPEGWLG